MCENPQDQQFLTYSLTVDLHPFWCLVWTRTEPLVHICMPLCIDRDILIFIAHVHRFPYFLSGMKCLESNPFKHKTNVMLLLMNSAKRFKIALNSLHFEYLNGRSRPTLTSTSWIRCAGLYLHQSTSVANICSSQGLRPSRSGASSTFCLKIHIHCTLSQKRLVPVLLYLFLITWYQMEITLYLCIVTARVLPAQAVCSNGLQLERGQVWRLQNTTQCKEKAFECLGADWAYWHGPFHQGHTPSDSLHGHQWGLSGTCNGCY